MIILDASALIAQLDKNDVHHHSACEFLLEFPDEKLAASVITLAEALVAPARADRLDEAQALLRELGVAPIGLSTDAVSRLAVLRAETSLRMPDCCVLLAAALAGAKTIATFDERLARVSAGRGLNIPGTEDPPSAGDESR
ncbi:MAG: type II toxin-antitoxin system VapC family toxin [Solirubrobacteraceae bacterium]